MMKIQEVISEILAEISAFLGKLLEKQWKTIFSFIILVSSFIDKLTELDRFPNVFLVLK
jgi:hypothetical protein